MYDFLDSNLFVGLATIITGTAVIVIYFLQKRTNKQSAARLLLTEIRIAEERIDQIKEKMDTGMTNDLPPVFPTKSWKLYSHLFINDFDQDELKLMNSFYDYGELIEEFAKRNNDYFWATTQERARITVEKLSDFITESFKEESPDAYISEKRDFLSKYLDLYNYPYAPTKTISGIKVFITKIRSITTSAVGIKLKKIAKLN